MDKKSVTRTMPRREAVITAASTLSATSLAALGGVLSARTARAQHSFDRSRPVVAALRTATGLEYEDITDSDLLQITELRLPHIHIPTFLAEDLRGLNNLKLLTMESVFHTWNHEAASLPETVFHEAPSLEHLSFGGCGFPDPLPDDLFTGLDHLKELDLTWLEVPNLPESLFALTSLETLKIPGLSGPPSEQMERLEEQFRDIIET